MIYKYYVSISEFNKEFVIINKRWVHVSYKIVYKFIKNINLQIHLEHLRIL